MSDDPIYNGLVRRRRFLIATSLALAAAGYLGLRIDEVNILGNRAIVGHPERIALVGYAVWFWALWTYVQWFHDYHTWTKTLAAFVVARDGLLLSAMRGTKPPPELLQPFENQCRNAVSALWKRDGDPRGEDLEMRVSPTAVTRGHDGEYLCVCDLSGFARMFPAGEQSWGTAGYFRVPIPRRLVWRKSIRAVAHLFTSTRFFSEYFSPFLFAALPWIALMCRPCFIDVG